jgi:hypothetical protein
MAAARPVSTIQLDVSSLLAAAAAAPPGDDADADASPLLRRPPPPPPPPPPPDAAARTRCCDALSAVLRPHLPDASARLGAALEAAVFDAAVAGDACASPAGLAYYRDDVRRLMFALQRQPRVRRGLGDGTLAPARLVAAVREDVAGASPSASSSPALQPHPQLVNGQVGVPRLLEDLADGDDLGRWLDLGGGGGSGGGGAAAAAASTVGGALPPQAAMAVLLLLPPGDVCRLGSTCRAVREVCGTGLLWRLLAERDYGGGGSAQTRTTAAAAAAAAAAGSSAAAASVASFVPAVAFTDASAAQPPSAKRLRAADADGNGHAHTTAAAAPAIGPIHSPADCAAGTCNCVALADASAAGLPPARRSMPPSGAVAAAAPSQPRAQPPAPAPAPAPVYRRRPGEPWRACYVRLHAEAAAARRKASAHCELCRVCGARAAEVRYAQRGSFQSVKYTACGSCGGVHVLERHAADLPVMALLPTG